MTDSPKLRPILTLSDEKAQHAYAVEIEERDGHTEMIVHANNRDQAARRAARWGYQVRSVNMIG